MTVVTAYCLAEAIESEGKENAVVNAGGRGDRLFDVTQQKIMLSLDYLQ